MASFVGRATQAAKRLRSVSAKDYRAVAIPAGHVLDEARQSQDLIGRRSYFDVVINDAWLTVGRRWLNDFDPAVYVVTEFDYAGQSQAAPFIVGPQLIAANLQGGPTDGIRFTDTRVAGPHPFPGRLGLTVVLCAVARDAHARDVLNTMETAVKALDLATAVVPYLKIAQVIVNGLDSLATAEKITSIVGQRTEFDHADGLVAPLYQALIASETVTSDHLWVRHGRLETGDGPEATRPYREADFVLYRLGASSRRDDVDDLPLRALRERAFAQAARVTLAGDDKRQEDPLWQQAKATLFNLEEEALGSPDLIESDVDQLIEEWRDRMLAIRRLAERRVEMGPAVAESVEAKRQRRAAGALDL